MYCVNMILGYHEEAMIEDGKGYIRVIASYNDYNNYGEAISFGYDELEIFVENLDAIIWFDRNGNEYQIDDYEVSNDIIYPLAWKRRENER